MLAKAQNGDLFAQWLTHIDTLKTREAFCYLIGHAAVFRSLSCYPERKGAVRDVRFVNEGGEQPFSFIPNKRWILFYFRLPAIRSGKFLFRELSATFDSAAQNKTGEWSVKLRSIDDVQQLLGFLSIE